MMLLEMCSGGDRLNSAAEQPAGLDRPVILLGRGGSGTRMLSELALGLGVFLGGALNETGDSLEWVESLRELGIATCAGELPAVETMATIVRQGANAESHAPFTTIGTWIEANSYEIAGPCREVFLEPVTGSHGFASALIEIQFPVRREPASWPASR